MQYDLAILLLGTYSKEITSSSDKKDTCLLTFITEKYLISSMSPFQFSILYMCFRSYYYLQKQMNLQKLTCHMIVFLWHYGKGKTAGTEERPAKRAVDGGLALGYTGLGHHLWCWHLIWVLDKVPVDSFPTSSLLTKWKSSGRWPFCLDSCYLVREILEQVPGSWVCLDSTLAIMATWAMNSKVHWKISLALFLCFSLSL